MTAAVFPLRQTAKQVELCFSNAGADCVVRLEPAEALDMLTKLSTWRSTAVFIFQSSSLSIHFDLTPEGAQVFRAEICDQLALDLP